MSQNGVKYRTLCHRCNNSLLGARYDPAFISFVNTIGNHLKSTSYLPATLTLHAQPQPILRSLLGHIAAQGVDRYLKGSMTEPIRDYFLDESKPLPEGLHAYYWAYPYRPHVMFRDAAYMDLQSGDHFALWMLKFFPVAFVVTWGKAIGFEYTPHSFDPWRACAFSAVSGMPLTLRPVIPVFWPEAPTHRSMLMYGQEAIHAEG
jgi:hypothetical protein